jgi:predicted outer membrane repeat protein
MFNNGANGESSPTLVNVTFYTNTTGITGGGMHNDGQWGISSPTLTNVSFLENQANYGGGMYNNGIDGNSSPTLTDVTFNGNTGTYEGGGMHNEGGAGITRPTLTNVTFRNNTSASGGAIYFNGDNGDISAQIVNGLFDANGDHHIAHIRGNTAHQPHFTNCTFSGATSQAVYVKVDGSVHTPFTFTNSIFWGNNGDITNEDAALNVQYSIVEESGYSGTGNIFADPLFVDAAGGNLRLQQGSPAIDMGDETLLPAGITTDLDGFTRNVGNTVDMGAYESQYEEICEFSEGTHILGLVRPITLTFDTAADLGDVFCLTVTYFPASHPNATLPLQNGVFWTISGKDWEDNPVTSGFTATLTLPFAQAAGTSRACRWLEGVGPGAGWDCDSTHTTHSPNASVTRSQIHAFSDWAVGNDAGPTSVSLVNFAMRRATLWVYATGIIVLVGLLSAKGGLEARTRRHIRRNLGRYPARK